MSKATPLHLNFQVHHMHIEAARFLLKCGLHGPNSFSSSQRQIALDWRDAYPGMLLLVAAGGCPGKAQQASGNGANGDSHVEPGQEGALIGKEGLGLDAHGSRPGGCALSWHWPGRIEPPLQESSHAASCL